MPKRAFETLTETMFYVLLAFHRQDMCGTQVAGYVKDLTRGRVSMGPGTLYTILSSFQKESLIEKISSQGRMITYRITPKGTQRFEEEVNRLRKCLEDAGG